ncbi:hypothetical protein SAMN06297387_10516 [Streptomyces zhaozhouensis]|uniref:STAS domain-containing protein n=1 Tax=Streptomyces zhaozhouensis TaxID=1300267 RepID=A0A286DU66_9ACTN|nr:hypothetical protein SAMN06297387_10516 [Streptomyces zhaozhouensis]
MGAHPFQQCLALGLPGRVAAEGVEAVGGGQQVARLLQGGEPSGFTRRMAISRDPDLVVVDLSAAHVWDASVAALDAVETRYARRGKTVEIVGLNESSAPLHDRLSGELAGGH